MATLRKYLIAGLLVWLPFAATVMIIKLVIDLLDKTMLLLPPDWQPATLLALNRIPLVRSIYGSVKQISATIFDSSGKSFRKVVTLQYPRPGVWSIGFLTNEAVDTALDAVQQPLVAVFVPTTPNPTSGFIIMAPRAEVIELDMSVEAGFKFVISMGVIMPGHPIREKTDAGKVAETAAES